jgi:hypothetical protein
LLECIELVDPDTHEHAKRTRWTKPALIEWLNGFAEQTDVAPSVAQEPADPPVDDTEELPVVETESQQTDSADDKQETPAPTVDGEMTFTFEGAEYSRKVSTYARSGRRWARVLKAYVEILPDNTAIIWKD